MVRFGAENIKKGGIVMATTKYYPVPIPAKAPAGISQFIWDHAIDEGSKINAKGLLVTYAGPDDIYVNTVPQDKKTFPFAMLAIVAILLYMGVKNS